MARIYDKAAAAAAIRRGVKSIARAQNQTMQLVIQELGEQPCLPVGARTITSWMNESSIPSSIDDPLLFTFMYYVLRDGGESLEWVYTLLQNTSIPVANRIDSMWLLALLHETTFWRSETPCLDRKTAEAHITAIIQRLFAETSRVVVSQDPEPSGLWIKLTTEFDGKLIFVRLYPSFRPAQESAEVLRKVYHMLDECPGEVMLLFEIANVEVDWPTMVEGMRLGVAGRWNILQHPRAQLVMVVSENKLLHQATHLAEKIAPICPIHSFDTVEDALEFADQQLRAGLHS